MPSTYETDFYSWTQQTAQKLRDRDVLDESDLALVIEEIEDLGKAEYKTLRSSLRELIVHCLKWQYQPAKRSKSWRRSINKQITKSEAALLDNPSLKSKLEQMRDEAYTLAVQQASRETGLDKNFFPASCPYTIQQLFEFGGPEI